MVMFTGLWNPSTYINMLNEADGDDDRDEQGRHERQRLHHRPPQAAADPTNPSSNTASNNNDNTRQENHHHHARSSSFLPLTIDYGSIFAQATSTDAEGRDGDGDNKIVTWDEDTLSNRNGNDRNNNDNDDENDDGDDDNNSHNNRQEGSSFGDGGEGSIGTFSSSQTQQEQALPSLTAAFQSIENRPILINCMFYLAIYMTIAVVAYSFVLERWTVIDSLYFAVATFTTCGYGDLEPTTVPGQLFTIVFAIYGVIILGVFIAIFGSFISEYQNKAMKKFQRKKQSQMLETLFQKPDQEEETRSSSCSSSGGGDKEEEEDLEDTGFWRDHVSLADDVWKVVYSEAPVIGLVAAMSLVLGLREGWGITSTLYFCIMAATTTGYGDYTPSNQLDKLYCVVLLPLAVAVFGEVLGRIATVYIQRKQQVAQYKFLHRSLTLCDIRNMDSNDDGKVDREDFVTFMLVALQKVDRHTIDKLRQIFDSLDQNGNGLLEEDDLVELAQENYLPTVERIRDELEDLDIPEFRNWTPINPVGASVPDCEQTQRHHHRRVHTVI